MVKREKIGWIFIWTVAAIGLALSLLFFAGVPNAQELTKEALSAKAAKAKVGDVLTKYDAVELIKADANKITAKIYATPKWDRQGNLLVAYEAGTGIIRTQGRYVQYVPNAATGLLKVTRTTTETGVKEYWVVPNNKTTALTWTVNTDAEVSLADGRMVFTDRGKVICESPAPVAWDAKKKPVGITVKFDGKILTYDIAPGEYAYPVTVDPSVIADNIEALTGSLTTNFNNYASAHDTATAEHAYTDRIYVGQHYNVSPLFYRVYRGLIRFATSTMSSISNIDSAKINLVVQQDNSTIDFYLKAIAAQDTLSSAHINAGMFSRFNGWQSGATAYSPTILSDSLGTSGISVGDTMRLSLNAVGLQKINKTGTSQFYIVSGDDMGRQTIGSKWINFEDASPYIQVWYTTVPAPGPIRTVPYDRRPNYLWDNGTPVYIWKP